MAIARKYNHASGDVIEANEINEEFNQLITEVNGKPNADTTLQSTFNADQVDGFDADPDGTAGGLAVNNGTLMTNLDADTVDGYHASDLQAGAFATGTRMVFWNNQTFFDNNLGGWTDVTPTSGTGREFIIMCGKDGAGFDANWGNTNEGGSTDTSGRWDANAVNVSGNIDVPANNLEAHTHTLLDAKVYIKDWDSIASGSLANDGAMYSFGTGLGTGFLPGVISDTGGTPTDPQTISVTLNGSFGSWRPPHVRVIIGNKT